MRMRLPAPSAPAPRCARGWHGIALLSAAIAALFALPAAAQAADGEVKVMTRNLYLGADLSPALNASNSNEFIDANGQIVRDVDTNNFPVRAEGLAQEILSRRPHVVGLQEVSLWRYGPVDNGAPFSCTGEPDDDPPYGCDFTASTVRYDYLRALMRELNEDKRQYRIVVSQQEFDFEAPADYNGVPGDGNAPGANDNGEENDRLTMRDVILARVGEDVKTTRVRTGHFDTLFEPVVGGPGHRARHPRLGRRSTCRSATLPSSASSTPTSRRSATRRSAGIRLGSSSGPGARREATCRSSSWAT